jgi:hypothetical protein
VLAVVGRADPQAGQLTGADHVRDRHRGVDRHPVGERRLGGRGVHVVAPAVVRDQLRQRVRVLEQRVDEVGGLVFRHLPQALKARAQVPDGVEFGLLVGAAARPAPRVDERVERGHVGQFVGPAARGVDQRGGRVQ